jgi:hypothetical protein
LVQTISNVLCLTEGTNAENPIDNFLTKGGGDLKMKLKFVQFGPKVKSTPVVVTHNNTDVKTLEQASGAMVLKDIRALFESKEQTDLKIHTKEGRVFDAHRFILAGLDDFLQYQQILY